MKRNFSPFSVPGYTFFLLLALSFAIPVFPSQTTDIMLEEYRTRALKPFSQQSGLAIWTTAVNDRSCTSCHSDSVFEQGSHERTGKLIEPMAPSVNPARLTDRKKINKWFLRNCKWTFGRECTVQEKGDILFWLSQQ